MMIYGYALYDEKAALFSQPFFFQNDVTCIRSLRATYEADDKSSVPAQYPKEFTVFCVCIYDDATGMLVAESPPRTLGLLATILNAG